MPIVLSQTVRDEIIKSGSGNYVITAGKTLKFETTQSGVEILDVSVPTGKVWQASISVTIVESTE